MPRQRFSLFGNRVMVCGLVILFALLSSLPATATHADTFGSGDNAFEIEFVTIGDPGNAADTTGDPNPAGAVPYEYRMGKYEISEEMIDKANAQAELDGNPLFLTHDGRGLNKPATRVSWFEAARFANWLNTSTGNSPAYKFFESPDSIPGFPPIYEFALWEPGDPGYDPNNLFRNRRARYFLPSADEWYKAAFYDPVTDQWFDFPNGMNTAPLPVASGTDANTAVFGGVGGPADIMLSGGPSPFGTVAQAGNVWEWEETALDLANDNPQKVRGIRGFGWLFSTTDVGLSSSFRSMALPIIANGGVGFRIASVPEPLTVWLILSGVSALLLRRCSVDRTALPHHR